MAWWAVTLLVAIGFVPPGAFFGYGFVAAVLRGDLVEPGLTPLGYVLVIFPGVTSAACLGTVVLRAFGKPSAWLGCVSIVLVCLTFFLGMVMVIGAIMLVAMPLPWQILVVTLVAVVVFVLLLWVVVKLESILRDG